MRLRSVAARSARHLLWLSLLASAPVSAHEYATDRPDAHAPIGVMADHTHRAGDVMLSYRASRMSMRGNRSGSDRLSTAEVLRDYPVAPTAMDMEMHMLGAMWAPLDRLTLMAMVPFVRLDMDHRTRAGKRFTTRSQGLGDIRVSALVPVLEHEGQRLHLALGLGLPTGSLSEKDDTPAGRVRLPYPMQLGSGTFDLLPGVTWTGQREAWSWGAQASGTLRTGTNRKGYRLGHAVDVTGWGAVRLLPWLSTSLRLDWTRWGDIRGDDDALNPRMVPTADPDLRGGQRLDLLLGLNLLGRGGLVKGHRLALEVGIPVFQDLDGPQLEVDVRGTLGWQYAF